jgi:predicted TIM-barrel fold metal-dependent hydrolase
VTARRIDTHAHAIPARYRQWLLDRGQSAGGLPLPEWSTGAALESMEVNEIETAILSISMPGVEPAETEDEGRAVAREVNVELAEIVRAMSGRFGLFATLPALPDVTGAVDEAVFALDELGADGVILLANSRGTYLGDPVYEPLMEALNDRAAVVFVHPNALPADPVPGIPPYGVDFLLDTTRAALNMSRVGWLDRYDRTRIVLSHGGGFLPYGAQRAARLATPSGDNDEGIASLRRFWFDTALASSPYSLPSLSAFADPGRMTFGSDWPHAPLDRGRMFTTMLENYDGVDIERINRGNAESLFPRLARSEADA